ncbi:MAG: MYXO-CTERM sorting domain-containing protein [Thermomicrobiales bacterium]
MRGILRNAVGFALAAFLCLLAPLAASAHESRDLAGGTIKMVVGFSTEPAYTGQRNGLDLHVFDLAGATPVAGADADAPAGAPITGLEETLKAEVIFGDQKMDLPIEARYNAPGEYDSWVIPAAAGDYTFHIFGTINGTAIDETFTSSPNGFSAVQDRAMIEFPKAKAGASVPMFGTIGGGNGGGGFDAVGGIAIVLAAGVAGLWFLSRRRRPSMASALSGSAGD